MEGKQIFAVVFVFGLSAIAVGAGWYSAISQDRILTHSQKVRVQIISSEVHRHVDQRNKVTYDPDIHYRVLTPGATIAEGDQLFPISVSVGTESSAQSYADRFEVGHEYDGYISTVGKPFAYLIASPSIIPYVFVLIFGALPLWYAYRLSRDAAGGVRQLLIVVQILLALNLALAVIHGSWIMIVPPHS